MPGHANTLSVTMAKPMSVELQADYRHNRNQDVAHVAPITRLFVRPLRANFT